MLHSRGSAASHQYGAAWWAGCGSVLSVRPFVSDCASLVRSPTFRVEMCQHFLVNILLALCAAVVVVVGAKCRDKQT